MGWITLSRSAVKGFIAPKFLVNNEEFKTSGVIIPNRLELSPTIIITAQLIISTIIKPFKKPATPPRRELSPPRRGILLTSLSELATIFKTSARITNKITNIITVKTDVAAGFTYVVHTSSAISSA